MFQLVDNFDVEPVYKERTYGRHQFSFSIDGKEYKGDYLDGEIQWLNPHPKQDVDKEHLAWIEAKVHKMLGEHGVKDDDQLEDIEIEPMLKEFSREAHQFKLKIRGEVYKGIFRNDNIEWFHPKPRRKLKDDHVEEVEKKVHEKVKEHKEKEEED